MNRRAFLKRLGALAAAPTRTLSFGLGWAGGYWAAGVEIVPADRQILLWAFYVAASLACVWIATGWIIHGRGR